MWQASHCAKTLKKTLRGTLTDKNVCYFISPAMILSVKVYRLCFIFFRLEKAVDKNDVKLVRQLAKDAQCTPELLQNTLISAATKGRADCAAALLEAGASPDIPGREGAYALTSAAANGHTVVVELLILWECDLMVRYGTEQSTALHLASENGYLECCRLLVKAGADINARNGLDDTPLILACYNGFTSLVKYLLAHQAVVRRRGYLDRTALHCATENGHLQICKILVSAKADYEEDDSFGNTPLISAAEKGYVELLKLYLATGCEVNKTSHSGCTALHFAAQHGDYECCRLLLAAGAEIDAQEVRRFTPLMMAAMNGHVSIIDLLVECKCNVSMAAYNKRTALHLAAERGHLQCCRRLLQVGCFIDAQDSMGSTPIFVAASKGHAPLVSFFIDQRADLDKSPNNQNSLLHCAAASGSVACCQELVSRGFDIEKKNRDGLTPLISAIKSKHRKTSIYLLKCKSNVNSPGLHRMTALNEAVFNNSPHLVQLLLQHGANPDIEDDGGTLPLWFAVDAANAETIRLLTNAGCRFDVKSTLSDSCRPCDALEHAVHKQKLHIIRYLVGVYCETAINCLSRMLTNKECTQPLHATTKACLEILTEGPAPLKSLCRKTVRKSLGRKCQQIEDIQSINVPKQIASYLMYEDMDLE